MRYVALLRGINVGGNTMIKMSELKAAFEKLSLENVVSYINSGNIAFDARAAKEAALVSKVEKGIEAEFGKPILVMLREQLEIERILSANPFEGEFESHKEMHVLFMREEMPDEKREVLYEQQTDDERFDVRGREIYCHLPRGVADSLLGKGFIEKKLNIPCTGRNWRTVEKLAIL